MHLPNSTGLECFAQNTEIVCLQASVSPKDNMQISWFKKAVCFRNAFPHWKGRNQPRQTVFFPDATTFRVWVEQSPISKTVMYGEVRILMMLLRMSMIHRRSMCGALWWKQSYRPFIIWKSYGDWWHISGHNGEHCFVPFPCEKNFPVRRCTTPLLPSCSCLSGQGVSWSLNRKKGTHSLAPLFSRLDSSGLFLLGACKREFIVEKCIMWMRCVTKSSKLQSAFPRKCLPVPVQKLNIVLMCVVPLIVSMLRSTEYVRNVVRSSVWTCIKFCNTRVYPKVFGLATWCENCKW